LDKEILSVFIQPATGFKLMFIEAGLLIKPECTKPPGSDVRAIGLYGYCIEYYTREQFAGGPFQVYLKAIEGNGHRNACRFGRG
jgi:hypothetical protein